MIRKYLLICVCVFFYAQCSKNDNGPNQGPGVNCAIVLCTAEFVTINIGVEDRDGVKVGLDHFEVRDANTGKVISKDYSSQELEMFRQTGSYPLYDDSFGSEHLNKERSIVFRGFIGGEEVVKGNFTVFADCCHVSLVSGDKTLIID